MRPERAGPEEYPTAEAFMPARQSLSALRSAADGCRGCPLYEDATQTVFGEGREDADRPRLPGVAITRFGRIDTWVNNAALFLQGRVEDIEPAEYRRMVEVNLLGVIFGTRCAILRMRGGGGGVIVQLSSIVGRWRPRVQASLLRSAEQGVFLLPLIAG